MTLQELRLRPDLVDRAGAAMTAMKARLALDGYDAEFVCGLRDEHHQMALYAQGRCPLVVVQYVRRIAGLPALDKRDNAYTVTECDGQEKKSSHQDGRAFDAVVVKNGKYLWRYQLHRKAYEAIGEVGKLHGFVWGGDFMPLDEYGMGWDPGHFEWRDE